MMKCLAFVIVGNSVNLLWILYFEVGLTLFLLTIVGFLLLFGLAYCFNSMFQSFSFGLFDMMVCCSRISDFAQNTRAISQYC